MIMRTSSTTALTVFALALLLVGASVAAADSAGSGSATSVSSSSSTYGDLPSPASAVAVVNASLSIGGTNWLRLQANAAAWGALWNALRSDIASALAAPLHNVNLTAVVAAGNGLIVNYSIQALEADAARVEAKAAQVAAGGTSMPATALVYQMANTPVVADPPKYVTAPISEASVYLGRSSDAVTATMHAVIVWSSIAAVVVMTAYVM